MANPPPMTNINIVPPPNSGEDIYIFAQQCVFLRSIYLHGQILFKTSSLNDKNRMSINAGTFFGDLSHVFAEYVILKSCNMTDPPNHGKNNVNLSVDFLIEHYDIKADQVLANKINALNSSLNTFRGKIVEARNKYISHHDRTAILNGLALGAASDAEWNRFWSDLREIVSIIHEKVLGSPFDILAVSMASDADRLLEALWREHCFEELMTQDPALAHKFFDMTRS